MTRHFQDSSKDVVDWLSESRNRSRIQLEKLENKKIAGVWINPTYINSWANPGGTYENFAYRLFAIDTIQVKGALTGGVTGSIALYLLRPYWPLKDISILGSVVIAAAFQSARLDIFAIDGSVKVNF